MLELKSVFVRHQGVHAGLLAAKRVNNNFQEHIVSLVSIKDGSDYCTKNHNDRAAAFPRPCMELGELKLACQAGFTSSKAAAIKIWENEPMLNTVCQFIGALTIAWTNHARIFVQAAPLQSLHWKTKLIHKVT